MRPHAPAFASLGALLIITAQKSAREFVLGQMGTPMGEGNCSSFSPAWAAVCRAGREEKPGFRRGGKTRLYSTVPAGVKPEPARQIWRVQVLPALGCCMEGQDRQAAPAPPEPPHSSFFLSLVHTCTQKSRSLNTLSICGSYGQFKLYPSVCRAEKSPA